MKPHETVEVLLVEDNPADAELTIRALQRNNLTNNVVVARDGAEALDLLFGSNPLPVRPRLILLDLKLPRVDGLAVLRHLKSDPRTKTIPVVVLTSSDHDRDVVESHQLGVNSYIVKPVEFDKFVRSVAEVGMYWLLLNRVPA
ncbi:MAG TPA: response regulator [Actinomycetota bacterium]|nr:response regulator [Actinomycetota bacterium]